MKSPGMEAGKIRNSTGRLFIKSIGRSEVDPLNRIAK